MESFIWSMLRCCVIIAFSKLAVEDERCANCFVVCDHVARYRLGPPVPLAVEWEGNS